MYVVVAGGGEVGFHLAKALIEAGHEVMVIESDRRRAQWIEEQLGSVVLNAPADEGRYQLEAGCQRADAVLAVTGEDPKNLVICQLARYNCGPKGRVIARVNDPKNEIVFKALGIDETVSSTRVLMNVIEQELPTGGGGFLPLMPLTGSHLELIEAEIAPGAPAAGKSVRSLKLPEGSLIGGIVRAGKVVAGVGEAVLQPGDRVIVFSPTAAEAEVRKTLYG
jgi:trk system potassium uptake protein TrkA